MNREALESALAEYDKICDSALVEYDKIRNSAWSEYNKICDSALVEREKIRDSAWLDIRNKVDDSLASWIIDNCLGYRDEALRVLSLPPATLSELDEFAKANDWCLTWQEFRKEAFMDFIKEAIAAYCEIEPEDVKGSPTEGYTIDGMDWFDWHEAVLGDES